MPYRPSRRDLLAGAAAIAAAPRFAVGAPADYDVAIIGAGAAGLSAAHKLKAAGVRAVVLEAAGGPGGRIASAPRISGAIYDKGANRLSVPDRNPLIKLARAARLSVYDLPVGKRLYIGDREARDNEYDDFTAALGRASRTISAVAELGRDVPASRALPDLASWQGTVSFSLGPLPHGKELDNISTADLSRLEERYDDVMIRQGTRALIAALAKPLDLQTNTIVQRIDTTTRGRVELATNKGAFAARAAIVTASTGVLGAGRIRFTPALPAPLNDAIGKLSLGARERAIFELPGNPLGFNPDERVIFKTANTRSVMFTMRPGGSDLVYADFGGAFGRELSAAGDAAIADFLKKFLAEHFAGGKNLDFGRIDVARWSREPYVLGGTSSAAPGAGGSRRVLMQPLHERVFFAGEAAHETLWGTAAGASLSGERAAEQALKYLAAAEKPAPPPREAARKKRRHR
ncbi:MAG TPA: NAD(P)/FAD-dependent oxidoreductase [Xanthobacteraceae bacterium]|nr:NAD(P)/FAD-dependent oxidoreductase [Xanthobacteraceae bacterium]